jgi:UDP-N-acetylglucosamine 2-epimerase
MKVLLVGSSEAASLLAGGVRGEEITLERRPDEADPPRGGGEIAAIANGLREFERVLGDGGPDAVLVASDSSASLAAVLVATKVGTPVAAIEDAARDPGGANADLIGQLADVELAPEAPAIVNWLRDTYTERP